MYLSTCVQIFLTLNHIREATDSFTITASPGFPVFWPSSSPGHLSNYNHATISNSDLEAKFPLLEKNEKNDQNESDTRILRHESSWMEKISLHKQVTAEPPVAHGCNLTQTIFNGMLYLVVSHFFFHFSVGSVFNNWS